MDFNFLPKFTKKEKEREFFLGLLLKPSSVGAILFEQLQGKLVILSSHEILSETPSEEFSDDDLVQYSDEVISAVEQSLPTGAILQKTIFALPYNFVSDGKITTVQLKKFKKLCEDLDLTPIGFIVTIEAIAHFLQKKEGVPLTGTFIEIAHNAINVYMVRTGTVIEVLESARDDTVPLAKTVESILKKVTSFQTLPSKMVLLAYDQMEKVHQEFLSFPWTKDLPFLHLPQVTVLEKGFENEAIINGVATQMGFEMPHGMGNVQPTIVTPASIPTVHMQEQEVVENDEDSTVPQENISSEPQFGFVKDEDIAAKKEEDEVTMAKSSDNLAPVEPIVKHTLSQDTSVEEAYIEDQPPLKKRSMMPDFSSIIGAVTRFIPTGGFSMQSKKLLLIPVIILLLLGGFVYSYYAFLEKAEVILFVDKKIIDKNESVTLSPDVSTNPEKKEIKLSYVTVEKEGQAEGATTGKKETGEKAKGEITLYNKTEDKKTFDKGTTVIGPNKLEYILVDDATVASTSAFSTDFSKAKVKVEASKFGSEYNIPSGSNFSVKGTSVSSYFAKNDQAFSGGTKKDINIVAAKDLKDLEAQLATDLKEQAMPEIESQKGAGTVLVKDVLTVEIKDKKFSKKEGDEEKKVSITGTIVIKAGSYLEDDIKTFIASLTHRDVSSDFEILEAESMSKLDDIAVDKSDTVTGKLKVHAVYVPKVSSETLIKDLAGKSKGSAEQELKKIQNLSDYKIIIKNAIPFFPEMLPMKAENIQLTVNNG